MAFEARLLAEDPEAGAAVAPGRIALLSFPVGAGVRIDANRRVGDRVDAAYPLLAVVTACGPDRPWRWDGCAGRSSAPRS